MSLPLFPQQSYNDSTAFIQLPAELRNEIYSYCLPTDEVIKRVDNNTATTSDYGPNSRNIRRSLDSVRPPAGLTQVCKQIRNESMSWWYSENTFLLPQAIYGNEQCKWRDDQQGSPSVVRQSWTTSP
jgi:hypothetical protein